MNTCTISPLRLGSAISDTPEAPTRRPSAVVNTLIIGVVAAYARFSNDQLQRNASIDDQVLTCSDAAEAMGWSLNKSLIFSDAGVSGAQMSTRGGLQALLKRVVEDKIKMFNVIFFDDTSRLGRNLSEVLSFCKLCEFHQVFLFFVNQALDSRDPNFYQLIIQYANADEQYLKKLKHCVTRGQKGRIREGMIHGGRSYGYKGVAIPDPTKRSTASKIAILGVKRVIDDLEAVAVRAIFDWLDGGRSLSQTAASCVEANYLRPHRKVGARGIWTRDNVWTIAHNRLYCGFSIYGKTTTVKHPTTGKIQARRQPESQWTTKYCPELAIVTIKQWERVQSVIADRKTLGLLTLEGIGRRDASAPISLFSGLLFCDECGSPFVVSGRTSDGRRFLQCKKFRYERKGCSCSLSIEESVLEERLIEHLVKHMLSRAPLDSAIDSFYKAVTAQVIAAEKNQKRAEDSSATLLRERNRLENELENIINSLRELGPKESLKLEFTRIEACLEQVTHQLPQPNKRIICQVSFEEARNFIHGQADRLSEILLKDRASARQAMLRYVGPLTLRLDSGHWPPTFQIKGGLKV